MLEAINRTNSVVDRKASTIGWSIQDINRLLNEIYALQDNAVDFKDEVHNALAIRKLLAAQLWPQQSSLVRWFNIVRMYSMTIGDNVSSWFVSDFERANGISLKDFYILSLWLLIRFDGGRNEVSYERIIIELTPQFNLEQLVIFFKMVSGTSEELKSFLEPLADESVKVDSFFANTQLTRMPLFLLEHAVTTPHKSLLFKSISDFTLLDFKARDHQGFRRRFTKEFEKYTQIVLEESGFNFITESDIRVAYDAEGLMDRKVVDFIINDEDSTVFIDAKGIEPHRKVQVSDNSRILKDKLKDSFIHGAVQAYGCAAAIHQLKDINISNRDSSFALIVTHQDFYLSNGSKINEHIDPGLHQRLVEDHGDHIPIEHVYFVPIEDFEGIMKLCVDAGTSVSDFLSFCVEQDKDPETSKFDARQHINAYAQSKGLKSVGPIGTNHILARKDEIFDQLTEMTQANLAHWSQLGLLGLSAYCSKHDQLKEQLGLSIKLRPYFHRNGFMV